MSELVVHREVRLLFAEGHTPKQQLDDSALGVYLGAGHRFGAEACKSDTEGACPTGELVLVPDDEGINRATMFTRHYKEASGYSVVDAGIVKGKKAIHVLGSQADFQARRKAHFGKLLAAGEMTQKQYNRRMEKTTSSIKQAEG